MGDAVVQPAPVIDEFVNHPGGSGAADNQQNILAGTRPTVPKIFQCMQKSRFRGIKPRQFIEKDRFLPFGKCFERCGKLMKSIEPTYSVTPIDSVKFCTTGGDGCHFAFLTDFGTRQDLENAPIVFVDPMDFAECVRLVANNLKDLLGLFCYFGYTEAFRLYRDFKFLKGFQPPEAIRTLIGRFLEMDGLFLPSDAKMQVRFQIMLPLLLLLSVCNGQTTTRNMASSTANPLLCDIQTGLCETPDTTGPTGDVALVAQHKPLRILYFTDPICSSCWGIEPQLRRLKLEYGSQLDIEYHMGGLLPDWSYNSGGISKPSDVAGHWDEVSHHYDMPIDGDVWLEDPLDSSYPPSIAFKAAQMQDGKKALLFLRRIREQVFLEKKNITKWEHLAAAATQVGLDARQLKIDFEGAAKQAFQDDLTLARSLGVRGFPTLFFSDTSGNRLTLYGVRPYAQFEQHLLTLAPEIPKTNFETTPEALFAHYPTLTAKEFSVLSGQPRAEAEKVLDVLTEQKKLKKGVTKNGSLWMWIKEDSK